MYYYLLSLRILHIVCGIFWGGTILFLTFYVFPAVRRSGPDGGKMMQAITSTNRFATVLAIAALVTIVSGILLMWRVSGAFIPEWFSTGYGASLTTGGILAIVAFAQGMIINRPAVGRLQEIAAKAGATPSDAQRAEMLAIRNRIFLSTKFMAAWLGVAMVAMAIARYV